MSVSMPHVHSQPTPTLTHIFYPDVPLHTHMGKCHEASSCVTCMGICRSTEAHHKPAMLADQTKEETATRKLEIMTSTFTCKTAITLPAHSLASLWSKQIYLLERCLCCDLTLGEREGTGLGFLCFISLTLIPCYRKHKHHHAHHHGCWVHWNQPWLGRWRHKPANKSPQNCGWSPPALSTHSTPWSWLYWCFMEENFSRA